jgi:hypothetical protein
MKKLLLAIITAFTVVSIVSAQNAPTIGVALKTDININSGQNYIIVNGISDADPATQTVSVSATSSNTSVLSVTSVQFTSGQPFAIINVRERGTNGSVTLTVSATDADGTTNQNYTVNVGNYFQRGVLHDVYDMIFWGQTTPVNQSSLATTVVSNFAIVSDNNYYTPLPLTVGPSSGLPKDDFFTSRLMGFLIPPASGVYTFTINSQDQGSFAIGNDLAPLALNQIIKTDLPTGSPTRTGNATLTGGVVYAVRGVSWNIHDLNYRVTWSGPGLTGTNVISSDYLLPYYDLQKPTAPNTLQTTFRGTTSATIKWKSSTDNDKVDGYNVYRNGVKITTLKDSSLVLSGLTPATDYSIFVTAFDKAGNESFASNVTNFTTYSNDVTPPTPPSSIVATSINDMSAVINWSGATDVGSEIFRYNVYLNDVIYEPNQTITGNSIVLKVLKPRTVYNVKIESIDGGENISVFSDTFTFTTTSFNPTITATGIKKARVTFSASIFGRNTGFGINGPYRNADYYSPTGNSRVLIKDLNAKLERWGALEANPMRFDAYSGAGKTATYARFLNECNKAGAYAAITVGVENSTDWRTDINTFRRFMEYLNGPTSTTGGALRASEFGGQYAQPLLANSKGLIIELGNEVWGGFNDAPGAVNHNAQIGTDYIAYGQWCRSVAGVIASSPYYDPNKVFVCYSGRDPHPDNSYGLHDRMVPQGADATNIYFYAPAGYLGGNLNYSPAIPAGQSEIDYYKNLFFTINKNISGLKLDLTTFKNRTGRQFRSFFYESSTTNEAYNGRLGQAVASADYYLASQKWGGITTGLFSLDGGQWRLVEPAENNRRLPMFQIAKLVNTYTTGNMLFTDVQSSEVVRSATGQIATGMEPVGTYMTYDSTRYSLIFASRDFENDYQVQVNLPNGWTFSPTAQKFEVKGVDYNTKNGLVLSTVVGLRDSMIVTVPKHSFIIYTFSGPDLRQTLQPLGFTKHFNTQSVSLNALKGRNITEQYGVLNFTATGVPANAPNKNIKWQVLNPNNVNFTYSISNKNAQGQNGTLNIEGSGQCNGNGKVIVRAYSVEDTTIFTETEVVISNQITEGLASCNTDEIFIIGENPISDSVTVTIIPAPIVVIPQDTLSPLTITGSSGVLISLDPNGEFTDVIFVDPIDGAYPEITIYYKPDPNIVGTITGTIITRSENTQINVIYVTVMASNTTAIGNKYIDNTVFVYPNPSNGNLKTESKSSPIIGYKIINSMGDLIESKSSLSSSLISIDISSHPNGLYVIEITTSKGTVRRKVTKN